MSLFYVQMELANVWWSKRLCSQPTDLADQCGDQRLPPVELLSQTGVKPNERIKSLKSCRSKSQDYCNVGPFNFI